MIYKLSIVHNLILVLEKTFFCFSSVPCPILSFETTVLKREERREIIESVDTDILELGQMGQMIYKLSIVHNLILVLEKTFFCFSSVPSVPIYF